MAISIRQGHPFPQNLEPGGTASFTIDVSADVPISGQTEWIAVKLPEGITFPQPGGEVRYIAAGGTVNNRLPAQWDPATKQLRFQSPLHLNDGTPGENGFYSINVQALPDAAPGIRKLDGALELAGQKAPLELDIVGPGPVGNLLRNGGFTEYVFGPGRTWGIINGLQGAGRHMGNQFLGLGSWAWSKYKGKGQWEFSAQAQDAVDLINGASDGHFPQDAEHPFVDGENFLDINGNATCGRIEQEVAVQPGRWYELSFYTGYAIWAGHDVNRPTYLHAEVRSEKQDALVWDDYVQYFTGKAGTASKSAEKINNPGWRKRRLRFQAPQGVQKVTVSLSNPGRGGFTPQPGMNSDGHSGMHLAHIWLETISDTISAGRDNA